MARSSFKRWLRERLLGPSFEREYVTVPYPPGEPYPSVVLSTRDGGVLDVTSAHRLLGVKPLVLGIEGEVGSDAEIALTFREPPVSLTKEWNGFPTDPAAAGRMRLLRRGEIRSTDGRGLALYEGRTAQNRLIAAPRRFLHTLQRWRQTHGNGPDPLHLSGALYDLVRIAYSIPRPILVASVGGEGRYNFFPVDFQGSFGPDHHLVSLRKDSPAANQLASLRRIALAEVAAFAATKVYALGRNHVRETRPLEQGEAATFTRLFGLPLLPEASSYLEAELVSTHDLGAQVLHLLRVASRETLSTPGPTLAHVHVFVALRKAFAREPFTYVRR